MDKKIFEQILKEILSIENKIYAISKEARKRNGVSKEYIDAWQSMFCNSLENVAEDIRDTLKDGDFDNLDAIYSE